MSFLLQGLLIMCDDVTKWEWIMSNGSPFLKYDCHQQDTIQANEFNVGSSNRSTQIVHHISWSI